MHREDNGFSVRLAEWSNKADQALDRRRRKSVPNNLLAGVFPTYTVPELEQRGISLSHLLGQPPMLAQVAVYQEASDSLY